MRDVLVVSDPDLVSALAAYRLLKYEASTLKQKVVDAKSAASKALGGEDAPELEGMVADTGIVAAAVVGKAITQLASLFELDVDVAFSATDVPAVAVQAAVIEGLLTVCPGLRVRQQWSRVVNPDNSSLLKEIEELIQLDIDVTPVGAQLDAAIKRLGDPAAKLAMAEKIVEDDKSTPQEKEDAAKLATEARKEITRLTQLQTVQTDLLAVLAKAREFADRVTKASDGRGPSALAKAVAAEPLADTADTTCVLVIGGAKAETYQTLVKRRIFWPRIQTSTSVEVDYLLVHGEDVRAGGHRTASLAFAGHFGGSGAKWTTLTPFEVPPGLPETPPESADIKRLRLAALDKALKDKFITQQERDEQRRRIIAGF